MPAYKITRQVGGSNFACVERAGLTTMCFVSYNVVNMVVNVRSGVSPIREKIACTMLPLNKKEALGMGVKINENKTNYIPCTKSCFNNFYFKIEEHSFEDVESFTYLGSEINNRNDCATEIKKRITMTNRCLNGVRNCRAASLLVRSEEGEERWEAPDLPQSVLPQNWGGTEPKRTVTCMMLKATDNDRRISSPLPR
ncbi:hypothetical protein TNCV_4040141 [Trichonephila clavipes]|nr:hypothetical protein TNCV_4040141 [Trichonephila clavipes]